LHGGDVVVAVNGTSVLEQNHQSSQELFQTIGNQTRATMTIERNGQTREVTVDVAQAGTSMKPEAAISVE
jgi:type II secretory pathway component PulC